MSSDIAIRINSLAKAYEVRHMQERADTLVQAMGQRLSGRGGGREKFWALDGVSLDIHKGEIIGIVGRNGAGKSTLLKILSRITFPTRGRVDVHGRIGSLLEVGTGFHPELTGRENVFLNGTILGMRHRDVAKHFDEIVDFAGVEKFLDTPVKRYSSGMYVRLAFAVAANLDTDILLVDEVLAVGDSDFQKKSISKMDDVTRDEGKTVVVVSHQTDLIASLASRAVIMKAGKVIEDGPSEHIVNLYRKPIASKAEDGSTAREPDGEGSYVTRACYPDREVIRPSEPVIIHFEVERLKLGAVPFWVSISIIGPDGRLVTHADTRAIRALFTPQDQTTGSIAFDEIWLRPGTYTIDCNLGSAEMIDEWPSATEFEVQGRPPSDSEIYDFGIIDKGAVLSRFRVSSSQDRKD